MTPYEFGTEEDEVIARLAGSMQNAGVFALLFSIDAMLQVVVISVLVLSGDFSIVAAIATLIPLLQFALAALTISAGRVLMAIPRTEGDDIPILMSGLKRLTALYYLQAVLVVLALGAIGWFAFQLQQAAS